MSRPLEPPPLRLALACFGSALAFLALGSIGLLWVAPDLARGWFPLPRAIAVVHLFTLGWITLSIIAALRHFVPVALHTRLMGVRAAWLQLAAFNLGLAGFAGGELLGAPDVAVAGAALLGASLLGFGLELGLAMLRARPRSRTAWALLAAAVFLLITLALVVLLTGARAWGWLGGAARLQVLSIHVRVALTGWVLLVLVAVAQRLLPMFLLTRAPAARAASVSLLLLGTGAAGTVVLGAQPGPVAWLPLLFTAAGLAVFLVQVIGVFRRGAHLDTGLRLAGAGLFFLALSLIAAPFAASGGLSMQRLVLLVAIVVLGGLTLFIAGHYYRLVPFLVWSARWAQPAAAGMAPRAPGALFHGIAAGASLVLLVMGAGSILAALGRGLAGGARAGAAIFACGVAVLVWEMVGVMGRRPH